MFFFERTFQTVLNGVSGALGPMGAITGIANAVLLLCALFAVYEAYARGGDARMIGIAAAKFLLLGLVLSNYDTIFRWVNGTFNQVAAAISPNDWASNWPKNRYATAREFAWDLAHLDQVGVSERPELHDWRRRRTPVLRRILFYVMLALIPVVIFSLLIWAARRG